MKKLFGGLGVMLAVIGVLLAVNTAQAGPTVPTVKDRAPRYWSGAQEFNGAVTFSGPLVFSQTIDFSSATKGITFSSGITVPGAAVGDSCSLGAPAAAQALKARFGCVVTAADTVKVWFQPQDFTVGQVALTSGTPSTATATVTASSICTCTPVGATAAIAAAGCATGVSSTTLTLTGPNTVTTTMTYDCAAPVDPASGTFEGYVTKQ